MPAQTILFDRAHWRPARAERWLRRHGFDATKVDYTDGFYRYRQHPPRRGDRYFTKVLPGGVHLVIGFQSPA